MNSWVDVLDDAIGAVAVLDILRGKNTAGESWLLIPSGRMQAWFLIMRRLSSSRAALWTLVMAVRAAMLCSSGKQVTALRLQRNG